MSTILQLLALHCLCDFPLQGDFLARGKNHENPLPGVPWQICLLAHATLHAGAYSLVVPLVPALLVGWFHLLVDYSKSAGWLGDGERAFFWDQFWHVGSLLLLWWWLP